MDGCMGARRASAFIFVVVPPIPAPLAGLSRFEAKKDSNWACFDCNTETLKAANEKIGKLIVRLLLVSNAGVCACVFVCVCLCARSFVLVYVFSCLFVFVLFCSGCVLVFVCCVCLCVCLRVRSELCVFMYFRVSLCVGAFL